jgi:hypothetical protein
MFVPAIETQFIPDKKGNKNDNGKADSQAEDIDERIALVSPKIAQHYFQLMLEHAQTSSDLQTKKKMQSGKNLIPIPGLPDK